MKKYKGNVLCVLGIMLAGLGVACVILLLHTPELAVRITFFVMWHVCLIVSIGAIGNTYDVIYSSSAPHLLFII